MFTAYCPLGRGRLFDDPVLGEIAKRKGRTVAQVALRWLIQRGNIVPIPRSSNPARMAESLDVFGFTLTRRRDGAHRRAQAGERPHRQSAGPGAEVGLMTGLIFEIRCCSPADTVRSIIDRENRPRRSPMDMSVGVLDHYNVSTRKLNETVEFYEDVLGFKNGPRPPFNFPGAWLYSGDHPVLHLNDISQTDKQQRPDSGVIDHVAFGSRGFEATKQHLTGKGVPHRVNQVPNSTRWQIFLRDPNNVEIELNFETKNEVAG